MSEFESSASESDLKRERNELIKGMMNEFK